MSRRSLSYPASASLIPAGGNFVTTTQATRTETSQADWQTGTLVDTSALYLPNSLVLDYLSDSEPAWDVQYEANDLPASATPAWTRYYADTATQTVSDGILHTTTSGAGAYQYYERASGGVTASNTVVVETEVRIVSASGTLPNALTVGDGGNRLTIIFLTDRVRVTDSGGNHDYLVDMTVIHTVRGVKYGTSGWALYVDGTLQLSGSVFQGSGQNALHFGNTSTGDNGEAYWSYVYYALNAQIARYEADVLPTAASPAWTLDSAATFNASVASGELTTSASGAGGGGYYYRSGIVTAGNTTVLEARLRVVSASGDANWLSIWDGTNRVSVFLQTDKIRAWDGSYHDYTIDMTVNRVVRLVKISNTSWEVFIDGTSVLSGVAFAATATNWISFGHPSMGQNGEVIWDYVYYTLNGNFTYAASGTRIWPSLDVSAIGTVYNSSISWTATTPSGTTVTVDVSFDGGASYAAASNGGAIPGATFMQTLPGTGMLVRLNLATTTNTNTPRVDDLAMTINGMT